MWAGQYSLAFHQFLVSPLTSLRTRREAHRAEKDKGYLNFKKFKIYVHINIYYNYILVRVLELLLNI